MNLINKIFLNEKFIMSIILINALIIYLQVDGYNNQYLSTADLICTIIFAIEMIVKHIKWGAKGYWKDGWNRLDGSLVILSLPSIFAVIFPVVSLNLSFLLILRLLRVVRFFRVLHFFPNFAKIVASLKLALRESYAVLLSFLVLIIIFALLNCSLFSSIAPNYFGTPLRAMYAVFQICTVEGWYDIPNSIASHFGEYTFIANLIRLYFCLLLIVFGIIGMSFINSIFVDAMVSDNNDEVEHKLDEALQKINNLQKQLEEISNKIQ